MCFWKIIMKNGKEYIVTTEENNIKNFAIRLTNRGSFNDYTLVEPTSMGFNTVLINADDVSSIEYTV